MEDGPVSSGFGIHAHNGCLLVTVHAEPDDDYILQLRRRVLEEAHRTSIKGAIIDVSAVRVLDSYSFSTLAGMAEMITLLGARTVFVGFQAGVASALIDLDVDFSSIHTAITMEDAFELLRSLSPIRHNTEEIEEDQAAGEEPETGPEDTGSESDDG